MQKKKKPWYRLDSTVRRWARYLCFLLRNRASEIIQLQLN